MRWDARGFHPSALHTLEDLWLVPTYDVDDIRRSLEAHPPYGDYQGVTPPMALREPMRVYMSGGTTGKSRPTFYTAWDRMVGGVLTARNLYRLGVRPGDTVIAEVAGEMGHDPITDLRLTTLPNRVTANTSSARSEWITSRCTASTRCRTWRASAMCDGLHIYEDAFVVHVVGGLRSTDRRVARSGR